MVCKIEVCQWFRYSRTFERLDLLCKLLHLCSAHELRFIAAVVEDNARRDFNSLRESAAKANDISVLQKLRPDVFEAVDRSTLLVYLSLLESTNIVCSHALFQMLSRIEAQITYHVHRHKDKCAIPMLDQDVAEDVMLIYTMAAYHPAFTISQRLTLSDYLQKAQIYLASYFKHDMEEGSVKSTESNSSTSSSSVNSPQNNTVKSMSKVKAQTPVHVKRTELSRSPRDRISSSQKFQIKVTWSNGEAHEICRTYQQLHSFHAELIRLFPKDSGAHRQERQIPYLPQEKKNHNHTNREFEEQINRYIKQLSNLPDHILQCDHMTMFFKQQETSKSRRRTESESAPRQQKQQAPAQDEDTGSEDMSGAQCNLPVPTAHALTTMVQQRYCYSSVVASPLTHHSPIQSPLFSPHVSPSQPSNAVVVTSSSTSPPETIGAWLKHQRLHKYAANLSKYTWQQLAQLDDKALEREGLTDGAKKKFRKQLEVQLKRLNGVVSTVRLDGNGSDGGQSSPVLGGEAQSTHASPQPSSHPLSVITKTGYPASLAHSSVCSTGSIGSVSPVYSDYSSVSPPTSPRGLPGTHHPEASSSGESIVTSPKRQGDSNPTSPNREGTTVPDNQTIQHQTATVTGIGLQFLGDPVPVEERKEIAPVVNPAASETIPAQAAFLEALQSAQMDVPAPPMAPDMPDAPYPRPPNTVVHPATLQRQPDSEPPTPPFMPVNPRMPLAMTPMHPLAGHNSPHISALVNNPPVVGVNSLGKPSTTSQPESPNLISSLKPDEPSVMEVNAKVAPGFPMGLAPRAPSLMGPGPGSHLLHRPANLGIQIPVSGPRTFTGNPHLAPSPVTAPIIYDKSSSVLLPPVNVPPPTLTPTSMDHPDLFSVYNSVSTASFNGAPLMATSLNSPVACATSSALLPSPVPAVTTNMTPARVVTPVSQGGGSSSVSPVCSCHCSCPTCQGPEPRPHPPLASYPPSHLWPGHMMPPGFPVHGEFLSSSSNGLVTGAMPHYISPHPVPPAAYNMTPDTIAAMYAAQGLPLQHMAPFHYPMAPGIYPPHPLTHKPPMCFNCGGTGHLANECNAPTMDSIARSGQFHLNLQGAPGEAD